MAKLSTKGVLTEVLTIETEKNYLLNLLHQAKLDTMKQEALLNRALLRSKDRAIEAMFMAISAKVPPDFMNVELEASGDEWVGGFVGPTANNEASGEVAPDLTNLPNDLEALINVFLDTVASGEAGYNGYNRGTLCKRIQKGKVLGSFHGDGNPNITTSTPRQLLAMYVVTSSGQVNPSACKRNVFATGKWQTIPDTLRRHAAAAGVMDLPYTPENQRKVARSILMSSGAAKFIKQGGDPIAAQYAISKVWASIAVPQGYETALKGTKSSGDLSYYQSDGTNKASMHATRSTQAVLQKIAEYHKNKGD